MKLEVGVYVRPLTAAFRLASGAGDRHRRGAVGAVVNVSPLVEPSVRVPFVTDQRERIRHAAGERIGEGDRVALAVEKTSDEFSLTEMGGRAR